MMKKVFETSYSLVTEENGVVYVKARTRSIMVTGLYFANLRVVGISFVRKYPLLKMEEWRSFCFWAAIIILPSAGLLFIIGFLQSLSSTTVFDFNSGRECEKGSKYMIFRKFNGLLWRGGLLPIGKYSS